MSCKHGNADWKLDSCELCAEEVIMFNRAFEEGRQDVLSELRTKGTIYEAYIEEELAALRAENEEQKLLLDECEKAFNQIPERWQHTGIPVILTKLKARKEL